MVEIESLSNKIFSLLKVNGLKIKIFDTDGAETTDPNEGRRFFSINPNIMITINEDGNSIEFNKGLNTDEEGMKILQNNVKRLANEFMMNTSIKVFGKMIKPRDYSYQVKNGAAMNENALIKPVNNLLLGKVANLIDYDGAITAREITSQLGTDLNEVQKVLNKLVMDGKIRVSADPMGQQVYSKAMEEAIAEGLGGLTLTGFEMQILKEIARSAYITARTLYESFANTPKDEFISTLKELFSKGLVQKDDQLQLSLCDTGNQKIEEMMSFPMPKDIKVGDRVSAPLGRFGSVMGTVTQIDGRDLKIVSDKNQEHWVDLSQVVKVPNRSEESLSESISRMFGSRKTSHQILENVRILVKHNKPVDESIRGARSRSISSIFLECNGERFRFAHNNLSGARAMAQHLAHGGSMGDKTGAYISETVGNMLKLQSFNRYIATNKLVNESSNGIVDTIKENIDTIKLELKKLTSARTYESVKARIETFERVQLDEGDTDQLKDLFTIRRFDEKFEEVLPIVKQLVQEKDTYHKRIEEAANTTVTLRRIKNVNAPILEFSSDNARIGYKLNEFALRIIENQELSEFINKISSKLCKESILNEFEKVILGRVFENAKFETLTKTEKVDESLEIFFDKYNTSFKAKLLHIS
jgi:hypothetical protein